MNSGDVEIITLNGNVIDLAAYALRDTLSCDMLGLQTDDAAGTNAALLSVAINSGFKILVDKMYTIKTDAPAQISRDIVVTGKDENCGFNFAASTQHYLFGIMSSVNRISVENLKLQNTTGDMYSLFWNTSSGDNDLDLDELSVSGCRFQDVSLIRVSGNRLYNDSDTLSRCDRFEFVNNKVENARFSYCQMDDVLFKTAEIRNNTVHNFKWTLFSFSITNMPDSGTPHDLQKFNALNDQRNRILIENNYIYCDDDYIIDINASSTYYTAFLLECDSCEYRSNHVEGMKASANIAVYDAYLSCNKVLSEGNVWKNNICFNASKNTAANTLMKAKGGSGIRRFAGNKYIVTTEYVNMLASTYGASLDNCWVRFADSVAAQQWEIVDNVIDCYYLGMYTANMSATQWTITGNNISCVRLADRLIPGNVAEKCTVNYKNNHIHVSGQSEFNLMTQPLPCIEYNVTDNIIDAPLSTFTGMTAVEQTNGKEKFEGNKIVCNYARYQIAFGENDITAPKIASMGNFWGNMQMNLYLKGETKAETVADFKLPDDNFAARIRIIAMATGTTDIINKDYIVAIKKADIGTTAKIYDLLTNTVAYDGLLRPTDASAWIEFGNGAARAYIAMLKSTSSNKSNIGIESKAGVEAKISITTEVIDTLVV